MRKIHLVLSFDHELSLGGVSSYEHNLFAPADALLDAARELEVPVCLFTDVTCHLRFKECNGERFCEPYEKQLRRAVREGHDVQLHLHPHWTEVQFWEGGFALGNRYSLGDFANDPPPTDMEGIIGRGVQELARICSAEDPDYRCLAYRAGGYSYGPEEGRQTEALWRHGIRIETSVAKGYRLTTRSSRVDFGKMPAAANWFIRPGGPLTRPAPQGLFEVPIVTAPRTPVNNLSFLFKRVIAKQYRRNSGGQGFHSRKDGLSERMSRLFPRSAWMLSFDSWTHDAKGLIGILQSHLDRHPADGDIYCMAIGHPKSMGPYQLQLFRNFVAYARSVYGAALVITTCREISREMNLLPLQKRPASPQLS